MLNANSCMHKQLNHTKSVHLNERASRFSAADVRTPLSCRDSLITPGHTHQGQDYWKVTGEFEQG